MFVLLPGTNLPFFVGKRRYAPAGAVPPFIRSTGPFFKKVPYLEEKRSWTSWKKGLGPFFSKVRPVTPVEEGKEMFFGKIGRKIWWIRKIW